MARVVNDSSRIMARVAMMVVMMECSVYKIYGNGNENVWHNLLYHFEPSTAFFRLLTYVYAATNKPTDEYTEDGVAYDSAKNVPQAILLLAIEIGECRNVYGQLAWIDCHKYAYQESRCYEHRVSMMIWAVIILRNIDRG